MGETGRKLLLFFQKIQVGCLWKQNNSSKTQKPTETEWMHTQQVSANYEKIIRPIALTQ